MITQRAARQYAETGDDLKDPINVWNLLFEQTPAVLRWALGVLTLGIFTLASVLYRWHRDDMKQVHERIDRLEGTMHERHKETNRLLFEIAKNTSRDWTGKMWLSKVGQVAPLVGGALGGPAGGAVGHLAARLLGVDETPEALVSAISDPEAAERLKRLEHEHEREIMRLSLEAETSRLAEINKTMRAELSHEGWFKSGWRPALGWVFAASLGLIAAVMAFTIARNPTVVSDPEFSGLMIWLFFTMGGALGINVRERSKDKARLIGQPPGTFMDALRLTKGR